MGDELLDEKPKSIKKNYLYNLIYQIFMLIVPILVTPYVAKVLTDAGSGQYSFTTANVTYFTLVAALGFGYYAQRLVAKHKGDKHQQSIDFWNVVIARLIPVAFSLLLYFLFIIFNIYGKVYSGDPYKTLMIIQSINVIAIAFDVTFLFQGNEEFKKIVIRNIIIKSIGIASIFIFVKTSDDLWKYTLIQSLTVIISNISLWLLLPKFLKKVSIKELHPLKHIIPTFLLFIPTIAISVYTVLDKSFLGFLIHDTVTVIVDGKEVIKQVSDIENGNYEYAEKLVKMALTVISSLGIVMIPRNSKQIADGDFEGVKKNITNSILFVFMLGIPLSLGIVCIADNMIPWYLGSEYTKAANLMKILSPIIMIIGLSNVFGVQYLVPAGYDKKFAISIILGALVNLGLNLFLIPKLYSYGAAIGTVIGEIVVTLIMMFFSIKMINFKLLAKRIWKYMIAGALMFATCYYISTLLTPSILHTLIIVLIGVVIYGLVLLLLREVYIINLLKKLFNKFLRKKL